MPNARERYITIREMTVYPQRRAGRPPAQFPIENLNPLLDRFQKAKEEGKPIGGVSDYRGRRLYLMDLAVSRAAKHAVILWTCADPAEATQMYMDRATYQHRAAVKPDNHDAVTSAHMVIDFSADDSWRLPIALEDHEGISRGAIKDLLQSLLREIFGVIEVETERGPKSGLLSLAIDSFPGIAIRGSDLQPVEIELVSAEPRRKATAANVPPFILKSDRKVFKIAATGTGAQMQELLAQKMHLLRHRHPDHRVRVRWRDPAGNQRDRLTEIEPLQAVDDLLERALTRMEVVSGLDFDLPNATPNIVVPLAEKMVICLRRVLDEERTRK